MKMIGIDRMGKDERKGRGFSGEKSERKGSRKWVLLSDGSVIRWWGGIWRFKKSRWDRKVSSSLQFCRMVESDEEGKEVVDQEKYSDFGKFSERMVGIVGVEEFMRIVSWMKS